MSKVIVLTIDRINEMTHVKGEVVIVKENIAYIMFDENKDKGTIYFIVGGQINNVSQK